MVLAEPRPRTAPAAPPVRRSPPRTVPPGSWLRLALYAGALLVAFGSLRVVLDGVLWWMTSAGVVVLVALATGLARAIGRRGRYPAVAAPLAGLAILTAGFASEEALLGVIPTPGVVSRWIELGGSGVGDIARQSVPADATEGILFLLAVLAAASVAVVAPALDRVPAIAALPLLVVLVIPVSVREGLAEPAWYVIVVVAYLALLRVGRRRAPAAGVLVAGAVVVTGSLVLPVFFPPPESVVSRPGAGFGQGLNPLINLGDDLRRENVVTAVRYTTDAPGGLYLRLATLDEFTGITWEPDGRTEPGNDVGAFPPPPGLAAEVPRAEHTASISVVDIGGRWLPVPYPATSIEGLEGEWRWEADGLAVRSTGADARGQRYEVSFLDVQPDLAQLGTDAAPGAPSRYTSLPDRLPEIISRTAREVAGSGTTYERAIALQRFFTGGDFEYSVDAPVEEGYDGTGLSVIAEFLERRSGYCVHYASAMAVMARSLDIPSRIAVGFQPGRRATVDGVSGYTVDSSDLHAWPELYFEGIGWLRFEPTPSRGALPDYSSVEAIDDPETPEFEGTNPSAAPSTAPTLAPDRLPDEEPAGPGSPVARPTSAAPLVVASSALAIAIVLLPAGVRAGIRWRRMRAVRDDRDAAAAWAEIRDTARDHGWSAPESETPRELGARLAIVVGPDAVHRLRTGVEAAAYARPSAAAMTVAEVREVRRGIAAAASWPDRLRAFLLPPSLLARLGVGTGSADGPS